LWNESWYATALEHLYIRDSLSYKPEGGWKDCGSTLQELSGHAIMINALCDLLEVAPGQLMDVNRQEIYYHLLVGADYVVSIVMVLFRISIHCLFEIHLETPFKLP